MRKQSLIMLALSVVVVLLLAACGGATPTPEPTDIPPTNTPSPTNTPVPTLDVASLTVSDIEATIVALETERDELEANASSAAGEGADSDISSRILYVERGIEEAQALLEEAQAGGTESDSAEVDEPEADNSEADDETMDDSTAALTLSGDFAEARDWTMAEIEAFETMTATVTEPGEDADEMEYTGISLAAFLTDTGLGEDATTLIATASDGYSAEIDLAAAQDCEACMLVVDEDGSLRLIMPDFPSNNWVRDLASLSAE